MAVCFKIVKLISAIRVKLCVIAGLPFHGLKLLTGTIDTGTDSLIISIACS